MLRFNNYDFLGYQNCLTVDKRISVVNRKVLKWCKVYFGKSKMLERVSWMKCWYFVSFFLSCDKRHYYHYITIKFCKALTIQIK